jgi:hypothetical protein
MSLVNAILSTGMLCAGIKQGKMQRKLIEQKLKEVATTTDRPRECLLALLEEFGADIKLLFDLEDNFYDAEGKIREGFIDRLLLALGGLDSEMLSKHLPCVGQQLNQSLDELLRHEHIKGGALFITGGTHDERESMMQQMLSHQAVYLLSMQGSEPDARIREVCLAIVEIFESGDTAIKKVRRADALIHDAMTS